MQLFSTWFVALFVAASSVVLAQPPAVPTLSPEANAAVAASIARAVALGEQARTCSDLRSATQTRLDVIRAAALEINRNVADLERQLRDARERSRDAKAGSPDRASADADIKVLVAKERAIEDRERQLLDEERQTLKTELPKHQSCIDEAVKNLKAMAAAPTARN